MFRMFSQLTPWPLWGVAFSRRYGLSLFMGDRHITIRGSR